MKNKLFIFAAILFGSLAFNASANAQSTVPFDILGGGSGESSHEAEANAYQDAHDKLADFEALASLLGGGALIDRDIETDELHFSGQWGWPDGPYHATWDLEGTLTFEGDVDWSLLLLIIPTP